jgi:hypothetical protein
VRRIAIFSQALDIHALAILSALQQRDGIESRLIATDALVSHGGLRWSLQAGVAQLRSYDGSWIDVAQQNAIWWRRVNQPQKAVENVAEGEIKDFINNEWRSSLIGITHDAFRGVWVNVPSNDALAGNKLSQLRIAEECGFRVPRTLITQDIEDVVEFSRLIGGPIIAKKLMGTRYAPLATVEIDCNKLTAQSVALCPAIYQERIDSTTHLRVNCFGERHHSFLIESRCMDWRRDMEGPFVPYKLDDSTSARLMSILRRLNLEMGVFDFILLADGSLVWLELNTQGQFLFNEGKAGYDLTTPFCDFLIDCANRVDL